jgi:alpha-beta hydrolase superfamily lysophospholipase
MTEVWTPDTVESAPAVIIAGDLMAREGRGIAQKLGPALAAKGFVAVAANPSAHRETKEFQSANLTRRVRETEDAVTALFERIVAPGKVDIRKIAVVGHGVGGAVAVAEAASDSRVGAVFAIGAPRSPEAYFPKDVLEVWSRGKIGQIKGCDGTLHSLDRSLIDDWRNNPDLDHAIAARKTGAAVTWIHGTADEKVSIDASRSAYYKHPEAGSRARLVEIEEADHELSNDAHAARVVDAIVEGLSKVFAK